MKRKGAFTCESREIKMTGFDFYMPARIYFGEGAINKAHSAFDGATHAFIVTGRHSARMSGALDEVLRILDEKNITYTLFEEIEENPKLSICYEGGALAAKSGADTVVGIGGGSPLDAAKAIAAFAANKDISADELFDAKISKMLPLVLIPTTAGTGSEANNYSVLTLNENVKKTFKSDLSYAKAAIVDPRYTYTLSHDTTVSCALDAFCHCIESYLSPRSTDISSMLSLYGAKKIWNALKAVSDNKTDLLASSKEEVKGLRADLAAAACAAGIAINTTGTGFPHPLGYSITLYSGIPHGRACAVFTGEYIKYNMKNETGAKKLCTFARELCTTPEEIAHTIPEIADVKLKLTADERSEYIARVKGASNYSNSPYVISDEEMHDIYARVFG